MVLGSDELGLYVCRRCAQVRAYCHVVGKAIHTSITCGQLTSDGECLITPPLRREGSQKKKDRIEEI